MRLLSARAEDEHLGEYRASGQLLGRSNSYWGAVQAFGLLTLRAPFKSRNWANHELSSRPAPVGDGEESLRAGFESE